MAYQETTTAEPKPASEPIAKRFERAIRFAGTLIGIVIYIYILPHRLEKFPPPEVAESPLRLLHVSFIEVSAWEKLGLMLGVLYIGLETAIFVRLLVTSK